VGNDSTSAVKRRVYIVQWANEAMHARADIKQRNRARGKAQQKHKRYRRNGKVSRPPSLALKPILRLAQPATASQVRPSRGNCRQCSTQWEICQIASALAPRRVPLCATPPVRLHIERRPFLPSSRSTMHPCLCHLELLLQGSYPGGQT